MSVHYKFKSTLDFDKITFDGLHISVGDLKKAIIQQKRLGKITDFDLQIINAQTKEEYNEDSALIPKNTSLIIARVPVAHQVKKPWDLHSEKPIQVKNYHNMDGSTLDLSTMNGSEEDKIQAMMFQSTADYDPKSYQRIKGQSQVGEVPATYRCNKCKKGGHWIKNCPFIIGKEHSEVKRNTGIPRSFLDKNDKVGDVNVHESPPIMEQKQEIPEDLICSICKDLFTDAVMIPCCGSSFCDDCVRTALLDSEDNECPDCKEKGTSPGSLIPNRFLRNSVNAFKNETGYKPKQIGKVTPTEKIESNPSPPAQAVEQVNTPTSSSPTKEIDQEKVDENIPEGINNDKSEDNCTLGSSANNKNSATEVTDKKTELSPHDDVESDFEDNITVTMPPAQSGNQRPLYRERPYSNRNPRHPKPPGIESSPCNHIQLMSINSQPDIRPVATSHSEEWEQDYNMPDGGHMKHRNATGPPPHLMPPYSMNEMPDHPMRPMNDMYSGPIQRVCPYPQMPPHSQMMQGPPIQPPPINSFDGIYNHMGPRPPMGYQSYVRPLFPNERPGYMPMRGVPIDVRHPPHSSNLAHVYQGVAAKVGTGIIDDPLEAFNRIMKEKEKRKEERRRIPEHRRSRSIERHQRSRGRLSPYNHRPARESYSKDKRRRSRDRDQRRDHGSDPDRSMRHKHGDSFSDKSSRSGSWSNSPPRKRSKSPIRGRRSWSRPYNFGEKQNRVYGSSHNQPPDGYSHSSSHAIGQMADKDPKGIFSGSSMYESSQNMHPKHVVQQHQKRYTKRYEDNTTESFEPPPPGFEGTPVIQEHLWPDNKYDRKSLMRTTTPDIHDKYPSRAADNLNNPIDDHKFHSKSGRSQSVTPSDKPKSSKSSDNVMTQSMKKDDNKEKPDKNNKKSTIHSKEDFHNKRISKTTSVNEKVSHSDVNNKPTEEQDSKQSTHATSGDVHTKQSSSKQIKQEENKLEKKTKDRKRKKERKEKGERKKVKKEKKDKRERSKHKVLPKETTTNTAKELPRSGKPESGSMEGNLPSVVNTNKNESEKSVQQISNKVDKSAVISPIIQDHDNMHDETVAADSEHKKESPIVSNQVQKDKNLTEYQRFDSVLDINDYETDFGETTYQEQAKNSNLPPMPERSKWECEEQTTATVHHLPRKNDSNENVINESDKVTTEVLRKAENAIFTRAINAIRSVETKKMQNVENHKLNVDISQLDKKTYHDNGQSTIKSFQITVPANESQERSVEIKGDMRKKSGSPKVTKSVKERLGSKVITKSSFSPQSSVSLSRSNKKNSKDVNISIKTNYEKDERAVSEKKTRDRDNRNAENDHEKKPRTKDNDSEWDARNNKKVGARKREHSTSPDRKYRHFRERNSSRDRDRDSRRSFEATHHENIERGLRINRKQDHCRSRERDGRFGRDQGHRRSGDREQRRPREQSFTAGAGRAKSPRRDNFNDSQKSNKTNDRNTEQSKPLAKDNKRERSAHQSHTQNVEKTSSTKDKTKLSSAITEKNTDAKVKSKINNPFSVKLPDSRGREAEKIVKNSNSSSTESSSASDNEIDSADSDDQKRKKKRKYKKDKKRIKRDSSIDSNNARRKHKKRAKSAKKKKKSKK